VRTGVFKMDPNYDFFLDFTQDISEDFDTKEYNAYLDEQELFAGEQEWPED